MINLTDHMSNMPAANVDELLSDLRSAYEASEARFRAVIEKSADVTAITDANAVMTYVSPSIDRVLGFKPEDLVGQAGFVFIHPDDEERMRDLFATALRDNTDPPTAPFRARHRDGRWLRLTAQGTNLLQDPAVNGIVYVIRDVTQQYELEHRVRQSERLEAIGQLAGGISHDFNNVLLVIRGYTSLLRSALEGSPLVADVDEIANAAERAAQLTRQLLAFSRRQVLQPTLLDLGEVVRGIEKLLRRSMSEEIEMQVDVADGLPPVMADPSQMEQVLMNLVLNARDAIPAGGNVRISLARAVLEEGLPLSPPVPSGAYVALSVEDTGTGIDEADLPRIFEPFFTTKGESVGTGLGLSTVYGIVAQSGGTIDVAARPAGGTRMTVFLPAASGFVARQEEEPVAQRLPAGTETILLVEDEDPVRELVARVLEDVGYVVLPAARPSEAQQLAARNGIDLLLTDVVMPEMSGYDLATRVRLAQPATRTLFMSGYAHKALGEASELPEGELLRKPFTPEQLTRAVRAVLDGDSIAEIA